MKEIRIRIEGYAQCWWIENINENVDTDLVLSYEDIYDLEEDELVDGDLYEYCPFLRDLKVYVIDEENDIEINKTKGKYIKSKDVYSKPFSPNAVAFLKGESYYEEYYTILLNDNENFDPKKLQLVKSDYEFDFLPYGIVSEFIIYDGKKVEREESDGWQKFNSYSTPFIIDYKLPYA